jgi:ABC-type lipoprotein release transport system permease subunit
MSLQASGRARPILSNKFQFWTIRRLPIARSRVTGLALLLGRAATALLYDLNPHDPHAIAGAIGVLAAVGILASYVPACRAAGLNPVEALREE